MIAVFAAMAVEVRACLAALEDPAEVEAAHGSLSLFEARGVIVCQTGIGRVSRDAARALLEEKRPRAVLSVGTAGGLADAAGVGDLFACERVWHDAEDGVVAGDAGLIAEAAAAAEACGMRLRRGSSITVDEPAWGSAEKAALFARHGTDIVEMESFWVGLEAMERGLPYLAIRAVSDDVTHELAAIPGLVDERGQVAADRLVAYTREHPEMIPALRAQHERAAAALEALSVFLRAYLPRLREATG